MKEFIIIYLIIVFIHLILHTVWGIKQYRKINMEKRLSRSDLNFYDFSNTLVNLSKLGFFVSSVVDGGQAGLKLIVVIVLEVLRLVVRRILDIISLLVWTKFTSNNENDLSKN